MGEKDGIAAAVAELIEQEVGRALSEFCERLATSLTESQRVDPRLTVATEHSGYMTMRLARRRGIAEERAAAPGRSAMPPMPSLGDVMQQG